MCKSDSDSPATRRAATAVDVDKKGMGVVCYVKAGAEDLLLLLQSVLVSVGEIVVDITNHE
jgi:hypothetical protein